MRRGLLVAAAGVGLWAAARLSGSSGLHLVAVGVTCLPLLAWLAGARRTRGAFTAERRLSARSVRVGEPLEVQLTVRNHSRRTGSFLFLEDRLPPTLGGTHRVVVDRVPPRNAHTVSTLVVPRQRGRYTLPRLVLEVSDPFDLLRVRTAVGHPEELLVVPDFERLGHVPRGATGAGRGESISRQLFRAGDEFYAIREYQVGDDLRRIHWPSTARSGQVMIRQDEAARRARAVLFLDTRTELLGAPGLPAFERAVSAAASIGVSLLAAGSSVRLATGDHPPRRVGESALLEVLATVEASGSHRLGGAGVRTSADAATTLFVVAGVPGAPGLQEILAVGSGFGRRSAVLVQELDRGIADLTTWRESEARSVAAQRALRRAGWDVVVLTPSARLGEVWQAHPAANVS